MRQILFHIPFTETLFPPDGFPIYSFGAMLGLTFLLTAFYWGPRRTVKIGLSKDRLLDFAFVLFLTGIAGARIVYMIQYRQKYEGLSTLGLVGAFFQLWNGGIVFYGSVFGGVIGFLAYRRVVLRPLQISSWKFADAVAPLVALGLAIGRIGCYLNGCCWGQPACVECATVPLTPELGKFPLLSAHARPQLCSPASGQDRMPRIHGLQTTTGFSIVSRRAWESSDDPRTVVAALEPGSEAEKGGLLPGDKIIGLEGQPNRPVVELAGVAADLKELHALLKQFKGEEKWDFSEESPEQVIHYTLDSMDDYRKVIVPLKELREKVRLRSGSSQGVLLLAHDQLWESVRDPKRGASQLNLLVQRGSEEIAIAFTPRTVPFYPTQLYETISMGLLILVLLAYQPLKRHDGQLMVLLMLGYAAHRFLNEAIRIEPTYAFDLTLSQWISVGIFAAGLFLELFLRISQKGQPLSADSSIPTN